jgi:hypothetical protein
MACLDSAKASLRRCTLLCENKVPYLRSSEDRGHKACRFLRFHYFLYRPLSRRLVSYFMTSCWFERCSRFLQRLKTNSFDAGTFLPKPRRRQTAMAVSTSVGGSDKKSSAVLGVALRLSIPIEGFFSNH